MYLLIRYSNGEVVEAVVLSARGNRMRIAISGDDDASELMRDGSQWFSGTGESVEFEFVASGEAQPSVPTHLMSRVAS